MVASVWNAGGGNAALCLCASGESGPGSSQADPLLLAVFYDYVQLMPMVAEANQMSQELNKVRASAA